MAFPVVAALTTSTESSDVTTHTMNLPSGIIAGSLLMAFVTVDGNPTTTPPTGWTSLVNSVVGGAGGAQSNVWYKKATGSEGSTVTFETSNAQASAHIVIRCAAHADVAVQAPEQGSMLGGTDTNIDPPSLTPTGGAKDYLWIAWMSSDTDALGQNVTAYPTNYTAHQTNVQVSGVGGANVAIATRELNAASEDPGPFTIANADGYRTRTFAVHPGGSGLANVTGTLNVTEDDDEILTGFPIIEGLTTSSEPVDTLTHTVQLPSGIVSGDLLMIFACVDVVPTITTPGGWTIRRDVAFDGGGAKAYVIQRQADGTEGTSVQFTTNNAEKSAHIAVRIRGAATIATQTPELSATAVGSSTSPDPNGLSPTGGVKNYLWIAYFASDTSAAGQSVTAYPTNYTRRQTNVHVAGVGGANVAIAARRLTAATEDPNAFTIANSEGWLAHVWAIHPPPPPAITGTLNVTEQDDSFVGNGRLLIIPPTSFLVTFDRDNDAQLGPLSYTTPAGPNRVLVVCIVNRGGTAAPSSVQWNNTALTQVDFHDGGFARTEIWKLLDPPASTTGDLVIDYPSNTRPKIAAIGTYLNANDLNALVNNSGDAANNNLTLSVTTLIPRSYVVGSWATGGNASPSTNAVTPDAGTNERGDQDASGPGPDLAGWFTDKLQLIAGSVTMSGTSTGSTGWAGVIGELTPILLERFGTLALTEGNDTLSAAGSFTPTAAISGTLAVTEQNDTIDADGDLKSTGTLAVTETDDTLTASGILAYTGSTAVTETDDTLAGSGTVAISGSAATTEGDDSLAANGVIAVTGTAAPTEQDDTLAAAGTLGTIGSLAVTEQNDALAAAGAHANNVGSLTTTEQNDTLAAAGILGYTGTLAVTETSDTLAASGASAITGTLNVTETDDTLAGSGTSSDLISGTLAQTEADDTLAAAGAISGVTTSGSLAVTEANDYFDSYTDTYYDIYGGAYGWVTLYGTLAVTESDDALNAVGAHANHVGSLAVTEGDDTLAGSGAFTTAQFFGSLAQTEADDGLAATGVIEITGTLVITEANDTLVAAGRAFFPIPRHAAGVKVGTGSSSIKVGGGAATVKVNTGGASIVVGDP